MLERLIEKYRKKNVAKERRKLKYKISDLYIAEIVYYKRCESVGFGKFDHYYDMVKKYAIFTEKGYNKYQHVKSGQILAEMGGYESIVGDYAVHRVRKFEKASPIYMRKMHYTTDTKVSREFIEKFEDEMNRILDSNQEVVDLFK